jgi:L-threonine kinase
VWGGDQELSKWTRFHGGKIGIPIKLLFCSPPMEYSVKIYSRIGELMQGFLSDGSGFLVSGLPSRLFYSEAVLVPTMPPETSIPQPGLPAKTQRALALFLRDHCRDGRAAKLSIRLSSNIPPGKGLSSSSTDILCVLHVFNDYLGAGCSTADLYRIAAAVEPTDPCFTGEILVFRQNTGIVDSCVSLPPMEIVYFDTEPSITVETSAVQRVYTPGAGRFYNWLLQKFLRAAAIHDYTALFDAITCSAEYNQTMLTLPRFDQWLRLAAEVRAGLMIAHSGTIAGLLVRPGEGAALQQRLSAVLDTPVYHEQYPLL